MSSTRLVRLGDAEVLAELLRVNRDFLAPWEPIRGDDYVTVDGQRADIGGLLERHEQGSALPHLVLDDSGRIVGRITLSGIVRGPFQSCSLGYWVGASDNGRGLATAAVRDITRLAFEELGLHRIQAESLLHNVRSQRVLERNGFVRYGLAPAYLNIAGEWQDHIMYQVVDARRPGLSSPLLHAKEIAAGTARRTAHRGGGVGERRQDPGDEPQGTVARGSSSA